MIYVLVAFLNGLILTLGINNFKINKFLFYGGLVGVINHYVFEIGKPLNLEFAIFARVFIWITFLAITYVHSNKSTIDDALLRILVLINLKLFFERIIFYNSYSPNFKTMFLVIFSWAPFLLLSFVIKINLQEKIKKRFELIHIKLFITILTTYFLCYSYYFILKNI